MNGAQEPKIEAQLPSIKGHLNWEVAEVDLSAQGKEREKRKSEPTEIQDQSSNKRNKNLNESPSTLITPKSEVVNSPLSELNVTQEQKAMEQAAQVIEFLSVS